MRKNTSTVPKTSWKWQGDSMKDFRPWNINLLGDQSYFVSKEKNHLDLIAA